MTIIQNFLNRTLILTCLLISFTINAEALKPEVVNVDGREVILNSDGTWNFLSNDRYAETKDGNRVRLKDDGSWQILGNTPLTTDEQVRTSDLDIKLQKVVIETFRKKVQKNTSVRTQTVFYVQLNHSAQAKTPIYFRDGDTAFIKVSDDSEKDYKILSVKPVKLELRPGATTMITVRVEKSPSTWDNVKTMELKFMPGILGIETPVKLIQRTIDFNEENVSGFE